MDWLRFLQGGSFSPPNVADEDAPHVNRSYALGAGSKWPASEPGLCPLFSSPPLFSIFYVLKGCRAVPFIR